MDLFGWRRVRTASWSADNLEHCEDPASGGDYQRESDVKRVFTYKLSQTKVVKLLSHPLSIKMAMTF